MNGYNLIRDWYDFKFENPSKCKSIHSDFYCYIVDQWNRLGQKKEFGLPTSVTMESLGIGSYNTYKKTLNDLIEFGFIKLVKDSKNQHQSKVIAISKNDKANIKALDKASIKATIKPLDNPSDTIDKQGNKETKEQILSFEDFWKMYPNKTAKADAKKKFEKLTVSEIEKIKIHLPIFANNKPFETYSHPHASTYLNQKRFNDVIENNQMQKQRPTIWEIKERIVDGFYTAEYAKENFNYDFETHKFLD